MSTTIRRMKKGQQDTLCELFKRAGQTDFVPNPQFFADAKNVLLVSRTDGLLSGFLWGYVLESPDSRHPKMFLYSIDVFEEFRRKGIASRLIARLKLIAVKNNCSEIFIPTNRSNEAAVTLYRMTGGKSEAEDDVLFVYAQDALVS